jgi:hypothetical protein
MAVSSGINYSWIHGANPAERLMVDKVADHLYNPFTRVLTYGLVYHPSERRVKGWSFLPKQNQEVVLGQPPPDSIDDATRYVFYNFACYETAN